MVMKIERPNPHVGAIITGVNVKSMTDDEFAIVYQTWIDCGVICVRGQSLDMPEYLDYSRRFGRLKCHLVKKTRDPNHPEITVMGTDKFNADGTPNEAILKRGVGWHTDSPWDQEVCKGTQLYGHAIPSRGGDTLFVSMYNAWETLPQRLKKRLDGVCAEFIYGGRKSISAQLLNEEDRALSPAVHPVVRRHEDSGRTSLYINPVHISRLKDMEERESDALIGEILPYLAPAHTQPYRHRWQVGDVVIWDNRCTMHSATGDYPVAEDRIHWRVTIMQ